MLARSKLLAVAASFLLVSLVQSLTATGQQENLTSQNAVQIAQQYKPVKGQPHPDFILPSIEHGKTIQLSDYRGKKVLLLHFASW